MTTKLKAKNVSVKAMDLIINIQIMRQSIARRNGTPYNDEFTILSYYDTNTLEKLQETTLKTYNNSFN